MGKAKDSIESIGGRKIQIHYSKPRVGLKDRKGMPSKKSEDERQRMRSLLKGGEREGVGDADADAASTTKPSKLPFHFLVDNLPPLPPHLDAVSELTDFFKEIPGFDKISSSADGGGGDAGKPVFKICFVTKHEAMKAKAALRRKKFRGIKLNLFSEAHEASLFANARKNRLIVRNLPFKIDEQGLKNAFAAHGQVQEVSIPKRPDNPKRMLGFGFVQLTNAEEAQAALEGMNLSDLMGRKIAVDWAVPKKQFMVKAATTAKPASERDSAVEMDDEDGDESDDDDDDDDVQDEDSGSEDMKEDNDGSSDDDDDDDGDDDDGD